MTARGTKQPPAALYGLLLAAECLMWGLANALNKLGFAFITPMWVLVMRYFLSFWLFFLVFRRRIRARFRRSDLKPAGIVSLWTAAAYILSFLALDRTSATNCGFLMSLAVVFSPLLSAAFLKTRLRWIQLLPVAVASAGLYCICGADFSTLNAGDFLAILCSCASAMMLISSTRHIGGSGVDPIVLCLIQCGVCFAFCLPMALAMEPVPAFASLPPLVWGIVLYMAVGCTFLAYTFQNIALSRVSATFGALVFCTEPIFTAAAAYLVLGEKLSALGFAGAALILGGICLSSVMEGRAAPGPENPKSEE